MILPLKDWPVPKGKSSHLPPWPTTAPPPSSIWSWDWGGDLEFRVMMIMGTLAALFLLGLAAWFIAGG